jgi:hypothetical protein
MLLFGANKQRLKIIALIIAVLLILFQVGCGKDNNAGNKPEGPGAEQEGEVSIGEENEPDASGENAAGQKEEPAAPKIGTASDSFAAYVEAKGTLSTLLVDALSSNPDLGMEVLNLMGVAMVDLLVMPAGFIGLEPEAVMSGMRFMGATDIEYEGSGNQSALSYTAEDGTKYRFNGTYDAKADKLVCRVTSGEDDGVYYEYQKMPYGYVGQAYALEGGTVTELYQIVVHEEGGAIGLAYNTEKPAALTGSESRDFPKNCPAWYAIDGTTVTGVASNGTEFNYEYTP